MGVMCDTRSIILYQKLAQVSCIKNLMQNRGSLLCKKVQETCTTNMPNNKYDRRRQPKTQPTKQTLQFGHVLCTRKFLAPNKAASVRPIRYKKLVPENSLRMSRHMPGLCVYRRGERGVESCKAQRDVGISLRNETTAIPHSTDMQRHRKHT